MERCFGLEEVAAEVEADEGVRARDGDGEWRPRRREVGVAGAGKWRMGGGDPGGEDGGGGAVMRVIGGDDKGQVLKCSVERSGAGGEGFWASTRNPSSVMGPSINVRDVGPLRNSAQIENRSLIEPISPVQPAYQ